MAILIACLTTGKGTWGHVSQLINQYDWNKVILVTNDFGKEKFSHEKAFETVIIDTNKETNDLTNDLKNALKELIDDTEVALNMISGTGKEHMALLSALLKLGLGIKLVIAGEKDFIEL